MSRRDRRYAEKLARKDPGEYVRKGFVALCWRCSRPRATFVHEGRVCVRNNCACERPADPRCSACGVTDGHDLRCSAIAKPVAARPPT